MPSLSWFCKSFCSNLYWACSIDTTYEFVCVCVRYENLMTFNYITIKHLRHCKRIRNVKSYNGKYAHTQWLWWWYGSGAEATAWLLFCRQMFCVAKNAGRRTHIYIYEDLCQRVFFSMQCAESLRKWKRNYADTMVIYFLWLGFFSVPCEQAKPSERERKRGGFPLFSVSLFYFQCRCRSL